MKSPFSLHVERWKNGCGSDQCDGANNVVLAKGKLPCDILFVGEAPGISEDTRGIPFDGPAGILLDEWIKDTVPSNLRIAFTNVVGCLPRTGEGNKAGQPSREQIKKCQPRLAEFIRIAKPKMIVMVGQISNDNTPNALPKSCTLFAGGKAESSEGWPIRWVNITHPAAVLKAVPAKKGIMARESVVILRNAVNLFLSGE